MSEAIDMYEESDPKVYEVLARALASSSRATRRRAVAMLARVRCPRSDRWIREALDDPDPAVRETAALVAAWTAVGTHPGWPQREDPAFDRVSDVDLDAVAELERAAPMRWQWEYAVEVWRADGLLVGVYLSTTCEEDDEHAKKIALGQAVLASASNGGDYFEPSDAAAFIVGKRRTRKDGGRPPQWESRG